MQSATRYGFRLDWRGADPADPAVCIVVEPSGQSRRLLLGIWSAADPAAMAHARQLQALFPPAAGKGLELHRQVGFVSVDEFWRWLPQAEAAAIVALAGRAPVLERRIRIRGDQSYEAIRYYAIDAASGAIVAIAFRHLYGQPYMGSWPTTGALSDALIDDAVER